LFFFAVLLFVCQLSSVEAAPQIVTLQQLDFGVLALPTNSSPSSVILAPQGSTSYGSGFIFISAAKPGHYQLTGYPAYTDLAVTMAPSSLSLLSSLPGESLTVSAASTNPHVLHTDQNGSVAFDLGATMTTTGNGLLYQDGAYLGHATLTLNFDFGGQPQFSYQNINVNLTLRSSLVLSEVQALSFGKLMVYSSATGPAASLTLLPSGQLTVANTGTARIIRFGGEIPATIRVTTGSPHAPVVIHLPVAPVYLIHQSLSPNVARLVISSFVSQPATGSAALDAQGALDIRIGATMSTEQTANLYQAGIYAGTYPVTVDYY
jgi:hypothetical protein